MLLVPAADGGAAHADRAAARGDAGPHLPGRGRRRGRGRHLGGDRGPDGARREPPVGAGSAATRWTSARSPSTIRCGRRSCWGCSACCPSATFVVASTVLRRLRMRKDADEVALLRRAAQAADRVVLAIANGPAGRAHRGRRRARGPRAAARRGPRGRPSSAIVASGPEQRLAAPRRGRAGDPGGRADRPRHRRPGRGLRLGHHAHPVGHGRRRDGRPRPRVPAPVRGPAARPGGRVARPSARASRARRSTPPRATSSPRRGSGPTSSTGPGHGIGLEGHEEPYLVAGNGEPLAEGYAFSVEPGIYLEGRYGARIEDIVVCTDAGGESLNETPRDLLVVAG